MSADQKEGVRVLGITGPIGCGKSTVARMTASLGASEVIDADAVTRSLMGPGSDLSRRIGAAFREPVLGPDGSVDRGALGRLVFADPVALRKLEGLVHPGVREAILGRIETHRGTDDVVTVEAIRLLGSPIAEMACAIWLVRCSPGSQKARLVHDRGLEADDARSRMEAEPEFDLGRVDRVIFNDGDLTELKRQVSLAWRETIPSTA